MLVALAACGGSDDAGNATTAPVAEEPADTGAGAAADSSLTGVVWQWQGSSYNDDSEVVPDDPPRYTIEFLDESSAIIKADCNQVRAEYTDDGTVITITPGFSTQAACPEDSLAAEFLRDLEGAATYAVEDGELRIDIKFDTGAMRFAPA